jgi:regulatory protein
MFSKRKFHPLGAPPLTPDEALAKMEFFCGYRDRCEHEVWQKMKELRIPEDLGQELFDLLKAERFIDEVRFAEAFVRGKFRGNHWGRVRIRQELKMRRVALDIIEAAISSLDEDNYLEVLQELLTKKRKQWDGDPQARYKAAASLIRAGFEPELVFRY